MVLSNLSSGVSSFVKPVKKILLAGCWNPGRGEIGQWMCAEMLRDLTDVIGATPKFQISQEFVINMQYSSHNSRTVRVIIDVQDVVRKLAVQPG